MSSKTKPFSFNDALNEDEDSGLDISKFQPAGHSDSPKITATAIERASEGTKFSRPISASAKPAPAVPSARRGGRPAGPPRGQVNIKGPAVICDRFKARAEAENLTNAEFLERLMNAYDEKEGL